MTTDGMIPIYARVTIDGLVDEFSTGIKVFNEDWDDVTKTVLQTCPEHKNKNKRLGQMKTDLERHFDLMVAKHGMATSELVISSYKMPSIADRQKKQSIQNLEFNERLDKLMVKYIQHCKRERKAYEFDKVPSADRMFLLLEKQKEIDDELKELVKQFNEIFDDKEHIRTFVLALNECLLNFLQLALAEHRSPNSLEKMLGRKRRLIEFVQFRYKVDDTPLYKLQYRFITDLFNYLITYHKCNENTATKYCQWLKEIIDRCVAHGWMNNNIFHLFKCSYAETDVKWPSMDDFITLLNHKFSKKWLREVRDILIFMGMTGLAYQEVYDLGPADIIKGKDGELWISKIRQKTNGDESVPLLPLALEIIEMYKEHPVCKRRNRLLPVPTNQPFNRAIKEIARETKIPILENGHQWRYFFANEIAFNNGVDLKTTGKMLSHKSIRTTEIYVRPNTRKISESMTKVKEKLFQKGTPLTTHPQVSDVTDKPVQEQSNNVPFHGLRVAYVAR